MRGLALPPPPDIPTAARPSLSTAAGGPAVAPRSTHSGLHPQSRGRGVSLPGKTPVHLIKSRQATMPGTPGLPFHEFSATDPVFLRVKN